MKPWNSIQKGLSGEVQVVIIGSLKNSHILCSVETLNPSQITNYKFSENNTELSEFLNTYA